MPMQAQSSIRSKFFERLTFLRFFLIFEKMRGVALLLYEFSRGYQVDGSPRVAMKIMFLNVNAS